MGITRLCARRAAGVVHLHAHTAVEHEVGYCRPLKVVGRTVGVLHVVPVDRGSCCYARHLYAFSPRAVGWHCGLRLGGHFLAVVVENLCHSRSHAARYRATVAIQRTGVVVGRALAPLARHELFYLRMVGCQLHHWRSLLDELQLTGIVVEQFLQGSGQVVVVERTIVAVSQHVNGLVITRDDDEALVGATVEHVVGVSSLAVSS